MNITVRRTVFTLLLPVLAVSLVLSGCKAGAPGAEIELVYGSAYAPDYPFSIVDKKWIARIQQETNGRVRIKPFFGGTVITAKDVIDELIQGVVDIAFIHPSYTKSGYAIQKASLLFYSGADQGNGMDIFNQLRARFPEIEREYKGMRVLAWGSGTNYQIISRKPVRKIEDLQGMRIKTTGDFVNLLKSLGSEGVSAPMSEVYVHLQKGMMDGVFASYEALKNLKLAEVAKYCTILELYRAPSGSRAISLKSWNKLPSDIQSVFESNIGFWGAETDEELARSNREGLEFGRNAGVEFISLPEEELAKFYSVMRTVAANEARALDAKGLPGTGIVEHAQTLIETYRK